jgi:hypothetical protein
VEKYGTAGQTTDGSITRRMRFACWITKATDTHSEYIILVAYQWQKWLRERALMLHYTYMASFVLVNKDKYNCSTNAMALNIHSLREQSHYTEQNKVRNKIGKRPLFYNPPLRSAPGILTLMLARKCHT